MKRILPIAAALLLGGCSLVPEFMQPGLPVADAYPDGPAYRAGGKRPAEAVTPAEQTGWRDVFEDARLQALIDIAIHNNRDLRTAALNVAAAQSQFRVQRADLFPQIGVTGNATYEELPDRPLTPGTPGGVTSRTFSAGIGFTSFELDLFGRLRSLTEQRYQQYLGYAETRRSTQISLVAQVATAYLALLADQELLRITQDTLDSQSASLRLTQAQLSGGTSTRLTLRQAETAVDTARANLSAYTRQAAQDENALVLLLGQKMPADLPAGRTLGDQRILADLPPGLPSDLLTRRPDVVAAEYDLRAANANIGAARAAFFPSITLTGSGGVASNQLSKLFTGGAVTWSFAPQINIPLFTAGQNQANLDLAKVQTSLQVAAYEKTVQTAFREVSDVLAARGTYVDQLAAQQALVDAYADTYRLSLLRFRTGVDSYLSALDAQRSLYTAQQNLVTLRQAQLGNLVTTYKVLGGGWLERTSAAPDQTVARAEPSRVRTLR